MARGRLRSLSPAFAGATNIFDKGPILSCGNDIVASARLAYPMCWGSGQPRRYDRAPAMLLFGPGVDKHRAVHVAAFTRKLSEVFRRNLVQKLHKVFRGGGYGSGSVADNLSGIDGFSIKFLVHVVVRSHRSAS